MEQTNTQKKESNTNLKVLSEELGISKQAISALLTDEFRAEIKLRRNAKFITPHQRKMIRIELGFE